jgi:hypothetical protein
MTRCGRAERVRAGAPCGTSMGRPPQTIPAHATERAQERSSRRSWPTQVESGRPTWAANSSTRRRARQVSRACSSTTRAHAGSTEPSPTGSTWTGSRAANGWRCFAAARAGPPWSGPVATSPARDGWSSSAGVALGGGTRTACSPLQQSLTSLVQDLNDFQPAALTSDPSALEVLAAEQEAGRLRLRPVIVELGGARARKDVPASPAHSAQPSTTPTRPRSGPTRPDAAPPAASFGT